MKRPTPYSLCMNSGKLFKNSNFIIFSTIRKKQHIQYTISTTSFEFNKPQRKFQFNTHLSILKKNIFENKFSASFFKEISEWTLILPYSLKILINRTHTIKKEKSFYLFPALDKNGRKDIKDQINLFWLVYSVYTNSSVL